MCFTKMGSILIPGLQMGKLTHGEVKRLAKGHPVDLWQSQDWNLITSLLLYSLGHVASIKL